MTKRSIVAFSFILAVITLLLGSQGDVFAATLKAPFDITIVGADGKTGVTGAKVKITRLDLQTEDTASELATISNGYVNKATEEINASNLGIAKSTSYPTGKYAITVQKGDVSMTTLIDHKVTKADIPRPIKMTFLADASSGLSPRVGSIGGSLADKMWLDEPVTNAVIIAQSKTTIYQTKTTTGFFQLYLLPAPYKVTVVAGDESDLDDPDAKRSYFANLSVVRTMNVTPMTAVQGTKASPASLGYQIDASSVTNTSTTYKGLANNGSKVTAYLVSGSSAPFTYKWLGEALVKNSKIADEGTFLIKLTQPQPGGKVIFVVEDKSGRIYASPSVSLNTIDMTLTADTTKNELGQPIDITFKDASKIYGKNATVELRFIPTSGTATNYVPLTPYSSTTKEGDYAFNSGKLTILAKTFFKDPFFYQTAGKYEIQIKQDGFLDKVVEQTVTDAVTTAATLSVTSTPGSVAGTARLTVGTASDLTNVYYEVGTAALTKDSMPKAYKEVTADISSAKLTKYNVTNGITEGIDAVTNKYLRVYEVVSYTEGGTVKQRILRFKEIVLGATTMNAKARSLEISNFPIAAGSAAGTIKVTSLPALSTGAVAFKYAVTLKDAAMKTAALYKSLATDYATALVQDTDITAKTGDTLYVVEVDADGKVLSWVSITIP